NIDSVFHYSPSAGVILINGTDVTQDVNFTLIPENQLVNQAGQTNVSISKNVITLTVAYKNTLPIPLVATVVAAVNDSTGRLITVSTATLDLGANSTSTT